MNTQIKTLDSLLFDAGFNKCNISQVRDLVSDDFEFYHDEAGIMNSKAAFINSIENGICKLNYRPKRVLEQNGMDVFPLYKHDTLYAAIQNGFHRFYAVTQGSLIALPVGRGLPVYGNWKAELGNLVDV